MKKIVNLILAVVLLFVAFLWLRHYQSIHDPSFETEKILKTAETYALDQNSVPIEFVNGLPFIQVSVNGSPALPFILATGMGVCIFDIELAQQLNLKLDKPTLTEEGKRLFLGQIPEIQVGSAIAPNVPFLFNNLDWTLEHFGKYAAGFIGYGFLANYETEFNFPDSILTLSPTDSLPYEALNSDTLLVQPFANLTEQPRHVFIKALVNEKDVTLSIDTMIRDGLYLAGTPDRYQPGVYFGEKNETSRTARSHTIQRGTVSRLKLGEITLTDIPAQFSCIVSPEKTFSDGNVLGMGALRHLKLTLNYKKRQFKLEKK